MLYTVDASVDEPIMLINTHIGYDEQDGYGINGSFFQQELLTLDGMGKKRIQVWINSVGGSVMDGYNIYTGIMQSKTPVDTYCMGMAASIAGVIFQAGRKRVMCDYGILMYHNPFGGSDKIVDAMKDSLVKMIETRCNMNEQEVGTMMARTTFIDAQEAHTKGLCDEIMSSVGVNKKYIRSTDTVNYAKECATIMNSLTNKKNITMIKVTARLNLNDSAKEEDVVAEINKIENRATKAEGELTTVRSELETANTTHATAIQDVQNKLTTAEGEKTKIDAELLKVKNELAAMKLDKENAEKAAHTLEAKTMVENFAKVGRIKNDATTILKWTTLCDTLSIEEVKAMIEDLPLNKTAPSIAETNKLPEGVLPTTAMGLSVKARLERQHKN